ncbi:MAG: COX15/CtaA family protein [Candidatus Pelagibacter sp.]
MYIENKYVKKYISFWLLTMFSLIAIMIIVGGLTRLTDSGLSITTWELFAGFIPPLNDLDWINYFDLYKKIPEYKLQNYSMNIDEFKIIFWWEWLHRFLGRLVGISFLIPLIYFTFKLKFKLVINFYVIFLLICFQGFVGWYMVSSGLVDRVDVSHYRLSIHLLIAFIILTLILWNYLKINIKQTNTDKIKYNLPLLFLLLIYIQIVIGAFVSGMDAGKIYNSWPLMGNNYFPDDNAIVDLFKVTAFDSPSLVQFIHRNLAYVILLFFLIILFDVYKNKLTGFYLPVNLVGFLLFLQIFLGIITLLYGAQILVSSMHQISSIFLVSSCVYLLYINKKFS